MKVIPKLQDGGFMSLFTQYTPILSPAPSQQAGGSSSREAKSSEREESTKGKLTEKDLFELVSKVDGLPNDTRALVSNLQNMFLIQRLSGISDVSDLASTYLSNLYQIKMASYNKKEYDKAYAEVIKNGGLNEYAITASGQVIVMDEDDNLKQISVSELLKGTGKYRPLTNSNLLYLRAYLPEYVNNNQILNTVSNGIGIELVDKMIRGKLSSLGTSESVRSGYSIKSDSYIAQGLTVLSQVESAAVAGQTGMTLDGMYKNKIITKDLKQQAEAALQYIYNTLPDNAKTLLSIKAGNASNPQAGAQAVILQLITSRMDQTNSSETTWEGTLEQVTKAPGSKSSSSGSKGGKEEDPKFGFWALVVSGQAGSLSSFNIIMNTGSASVPGKYYGNTPGPDQDCSLKEYLNNSGLGYISLNNANISFGNITLSTDSFNDVMVNRSAGAYSATIPLKDGKPWLEAAEVYSEFKQKLRNSGLKEGTEQYHRKVLELLGSPEYRILALFVSSDGELNPNNSGHFLILEGITSSVARGIAGGKEQSLDDFDSKYMIDASGDSSMYESLEKGLSSEKGGKYSVSESGVTNLFGVLGYDKVYKGNIFIPLSNNLSNAANADRNEIKESTAYRYEQAELTWLKANSYMGGSSSELNQKLGII